jgi:hypothetical protein
MLRVQVLTNVVAVTTRPQMQLTGDFFDGLSKGDQILRLTSIFVNFRLLNWAVVLLLSRTLHKDGIVLGMGQVWDRVGFLSLFVGLLIEKSWVLELQNLKLLLRLARDSLKVLVFTSSEVLDYFVVGRIE